MTCGPAIIPPRVLSFPLADSWDGGTHLTKSVAQCAHLIPDAQPVVIGLIHVNDVQSLTIRHPDTWIGPLGSSRVLTSGH